MKYLKSLILGSVFVSTIFAGSYCRIAGYEVIASDLRQHAAICNTVLAVNVLKRQKADRFINDTEYLIRVNELIASLKRKGVTVK